MRWLFHFATPTDQKIFYCKRVKDVETFCVLRVGAVSQRLIPTGERSGLQTRIAAIRSDDLFKMLAEEKIGIFQDVTVIRHDKNIDLRVTPVEARMRS